MTTATADLQLMAHLMRRAGFGANRSQLEAYAEKGYEETVGELLNPDSRSEMGDDLIRRYHHEQSGMMGQISPGTYWLYKMTTSSDALREKMSLFWHGIFATGYPKITNGKVLSDQIRMFRRYGMGSFRTLLLELAKGPVYDRVAGTTTTITTARSTRTSVGSCWNCSRWAWATTPKTTSKRRRALSLDGRLATREYMALRAERDSIWPYGRISWHFEFDEDDHDAGEKEFLGQRGNFDGEEIIDIICRQPATAAFIARHMYHFFVADEPPVPQWPYVEPQDPEAIEILSKAYFESDYDIGHMLHVLFTSDFFKSQDSWYARVKSPAEVVTGVLRLTGEFHRPKRQIVERQQQMTWMGQYLINPPSVEGWHEGLEWIDTGTFVERLKLRFQSTRQHRPSRSQVNHRARRHKRRLVHRAGGTG